MVSIDLYLNETTRLAHVILPPTSPLERSHYDLRSRVRGAQRRPLLPAGVRARADDQRHDWEICLELMTRTFPPDGRSRGADARRCSALRPRGDRSTSACGIGPQKGMSLKKLRRHPHGIDLGPLEPRLPKRLLAPSRRPSSSRPTLFLADLPRLRERWRRAAAGDGDARADRPAAPAQQQLVDAQQRAAREGRAALHAARCTRRRAPRGLADGAPGDDHLAGGFDRGAGRGVRRVMPGVVSLPHGWGHDRPACSCRSPPPTPARASTTSPTSSSSTCCPATPRSTASPCSSPRWCQPVSTDADGTDFVVPSPAEALARLGMPMDDAMRTQRAVRRLHLEPVSLDVLVPAARAVAQGAHEFEQPGLVLRGGPGPRAEGGAGPVVAAAVPASSARIEARQHAGRPAAQRQSGPGQWQAEHFEDLPVFVVACYRRGMKHRPVGRPADLGGVVLRLGVPGGAEPAARVPRRRPGRVAADAADLERPPTRKILGLPGR